MVANSAERAERRNGNFPATLLSVASARAACRTFHALAGSAATGGIGLQTAWRLACALFARLRRG